MIITAPVYSGGMLAGATVQLWHKLHHVRPVVLSVCRRSPAILAEIALGLAKGHGCPSGARIDVISECFAPRPHGAGDHLASVTLTGVVRGQMKLSLSERYVQFAHNKHATHWHMAWHNPAHLQ